MNTVYNYLISNPMVAFIFIVFILIGLFYLIIKKLQNIGLEKIRAVVYKAFVKAEHIFQYGDNYQKFDYVVSLARSHLPKPFSMLITEDLLRSVIQLWFDLCKDLLDDGRINGKKNK